MDMLGYKINESIQSSELLVIDEKGEKLGVISRAEALTRARDAGLDLVEVAGESKPPVAKIISWSKLRYEQEKKKKSNKSKAIEQKEIWFNALIGDGDIEHKLKKVKEFIDKKHPVKMTIKRRSRRIHNSIMVELMKKLMGLITEFATPLSEPKYSGANLSVILGPLKTKTVSK